MNKRRVVKKRWLQQLPEESPERIIKWAERVVKQWHDDIRPDYIFVTETSAVPYGFVLKEAWKNAYPDETTPPFFRIDPKYKSIWKVHEDLKEMKDNPEIKKRYEQEIFPLLNKRIRKNNPKIIIFDEGGEFPARKEDIGDYSMNNIYTFKQNRTPKEEETERDKLSTRHSSLMRSIKFINEALESQGNTPIIYGSQQAISDVIELPVKNYNLGYRFPTYKQHKSRSMWSTLEDTSNESFTGSIVKEKRDIKAAQKYVAVLKDLGKEAGRELREQRESKENLERKLSAFIGLGGLIGGLFLLSSNITGNVIGLNQTSSNWIGIPLMIIGLIGSFIYFRKKK